MSQFRGVILDVDGTLVDSNDAHAQSWVEAFAEHGHQVDYEQVRRLIGKGGDHLMPEVSGVTKDSPEGKKISERRSEIFKQRYLPKLQAFPQAQELLKHMRSQGLKLAVASSAQGDELTPLLQVVGAEDLVEEKTSSSDAKRSKPDPDIIQAALDKVGMRPEEVVMLGDTPYDIESAGKAGVKTIALRCGGWSDEELKNALAVYQDPGDLLAHFDDSPLGPEKARER